jgi:archaellum component FlaC
MADNIWGQVQDLKQAVRQLRDDVDGLLDAYVRQSQDRYLDGVTVEQLRVSVQRLESELAGVKEALREALDDEDNDW